LLKDAIPGLEKVIRTDVEAPKVVLVIGPPGSMKTSFCFSVISRNAKATGNTGMYLTLEETAESHVRNMKSIGVPFSDNVNITDFTDIRELETIGEDSTNYIEVIEKLVRNFKQKQGKKFTTLAIDSLGALYSLMNEDVSVRRSMYHFFKSMRELDLFTLLIMEGSIGEGRFYAGTEAFLSDGVIYMGMDNARGKVNRFLQVSKMRACDHSMDRYAVEVGRNGLQILGPLLGN